MERLASYFNFNSGTLYKLLKKESIGTVVLSLKIALSILILVLLILVFRELIGNYLQSKTLQARLDNEVARVVADSAQKESALQVTPNYDLIKSRNVFGPLEEEVRPPPPPAPPPPRRTQLELIGTYISPRNSYAIIENKQTRAQEVFNLKQDVFSEGTLTKILSDRVELNRNGEAVVLLLEESTASPSGSSYLSAAADEQFVVDENELNSALENLPLLLTQARAVPFFQDGRAVGLRLFAIRTGSLYEKVGLRNGDILKSINGNSLADLSQALQLFERLKTERSISLKLERNREERTFQYQIR
jgi:general secretion pathway protein C